jgi:hypothetical protein
MENVSSRTPSPSEAHGELRHQADAFCTLAQRHGLRDFEDLFWYHTVDLGGGLVTPGSYDYRDSLAQFAFPENMRGLSVLDIESATGFFAFEFERRGADVTSVEIPSLAHWDRFPGETTDQLVDKIVSLLPSHSVYTPEQIERSFSSRNHATLYHLLLDGPFRFCQSVLGSRVRRCYSSVYDLTPEVVGRDRFDLVFLGDILIHTLYFVKALGAVVPLCGETLVIAQQLADTADLGPAQLWLAGDVPGQDDGAWWEPNLACLEQVLRKFGFRSVEVVGVHTGILRPAAAPYCRTVIHAKR